mmetsp:Transcript_36778/g.92136  ORF Transcript_36778/g.92136 Transcript_36778/m.92136 type:complete len:108 (-) Transcript_36778:1020-1343(-)
MEGTYIHTYTNIPISPFLRPPAVCDFTLLIALSRHRHKAGGPSPRPLRRVHTDQSSIGRRLVVGVRPSPCLPADQSVRPASRKRPHTNALTDGKKLIPLIAKQTDRQ